MPLRKIEARWSCDKCDRAFYSELSPTDTHSEHGDLFEIATERMEFSIYEDERKIRRGVVEREAAFHDGEAYCPDCWAPKSEELFIAEVRAGKHARSLLEGWGDEYLQYLPEGM